MKTINGMWWLLIAMLACCVAHGADYNLSSIEREPEAVGKFTRGHRTLTWELMGEIVDREGATVIIASNQDQDTENKWAEWCNETGAVFCVAYEGWKTGVHERVLQDGVLTKIKNVRKAQPVAQSTMFVRNSRVADSYYRQPTPARVSYQQPQYQPQPSAYSYQPQYQGSCANGMCGVSGCSSGNCSGGSCSCAFGGACSCPSGQCGCAGGNCSGSQALSFGSGLGYGSSFSSGGNCPGGVCFGGQCGWGG